MMDVDPSPAHHQIIWNASDLRSPNESINSSVSGYQRRATAAMTSKRSLVDYCGGIIFPELPQEKNRKGGGVPTIISTRKLAEIAAVPYGHIVSTLRAITYAVPSSCHCLVCYISCRTVLILRAILPNHTLLTSDWLDKAAENTKRAIVLQCAACCTLRFSLCSSQCSTTHCKTVCNDLDTTRAARQVAGTARAAHTLLLVSFHSRPPKSSNAAWPRSTVGFSTTQ